MEDILDMWKRKMDFLNKQNQKLIKRNGEIDGSNLIMYDLAILINKYDSYCKWKEKQKLFETENQQKEENILIDTFGITNVVENDIKNTEENSELDDNLLDLVDDIFG